MVWGCISAAGTGHLCRIDGIMDKELYKEILEDCMLPSMHTLGTFIFQQDNDPKHTSKLCREYLDSLAHISVLEWPAQSPDLNPIEHVWRQLKVAIQRKVDHLGKRPTNLDELWAWVVEAWNNLNVMDLECLVASVPRRIRAVIKNRGGATKY